MKKIDYACAVGMSALCNGFAYTVRGIFWLPIMTADVHRGHIEPKHRMACALGLTAVWFIMILMVAAVTDMNARMGYPYTWYRAVMVPTFLYFIFGAGFGLAHLRDSAEHDQKAGAS